MILSIALAMSFFFYSKDLTKTVSYLEKKITTEQKPSYQDLFHDRE